MGTVIADGETLPAHVAALVHERYAQLDPRMPAYLDAMAEDGANAIWHKHGTFRDHLLGVWRIAAAWRQEPEVCRLGLFHSAYSNSYVRMALFRLDSPEGRERLRCLVGDEAERLIHLFCVIDRGELVAVPALLDGGGCASAGIEVRDFRTGGRIPLSRRELGIFLVVTMADFAEQLYGWQDRLFGNADGRLDFRGSNPTTLYPGDNRPGLWMSLLSRLGRAVAACGHEPLPPVFDGCRGLLEPAAELQARDLYWRVVCDLTEDADSDEAARLLADASARNPFVAEPHALRAHLLLNRGRFDAAGGEARTALRILAEWGTSWDKRLPWGAWVAWTRVLLRAARERSWPDTAMGMISLGDVGD
jgi:hypothetical protein